MVNLLTKPCTRCDWRYPSFHICLDLPKKIMQQVEDGYERDTNGEMIVDEFKPKKSKAKNPNISHRQAISDGVRAKWTNDPKRIARDVEIVRLYEEEQLTIRDVAKALTLADKTVMSALHRAAANGDVVIRPAGPRSKVA